jgi:uncharacterized protein (TIGR04255 family)
MQVSPLKLFQPAQLGLFWATVRSRYPRTEQHPPQAPAIETFDIRAVPEPSIRLQLVDPSSMQRFWFLCEDGTELIQLQQDRIGYNWRKDTDEGPKPVTYPGYEQVRQTFLAEATHLEEFLRTERLGELVPVQCEITYVNQLAVRHSDVDRALTVWRNPQGVGLPNTPENVDVSVRYLITGDGTAPLGRLHVDAKPALQRPDLQEVILLTLTARGRPVGEGLAGAARFLDLGHDWAFRAFTAITSIELQRTWGRANADDANRPA